MSGYIQSNQVVLLPDDDVHFEEADTGKIYSIPLLTVDRTYRLPPLNAGSHLTFVNHTTNATLEFDAIIDAYEVGNNIYGVLLNTPAAVVSLDNSADVRFVALSVKGDYVKCTCDGLRWYVSGMSGVVGLA